MNRALPKIVLVGGGQMGSLHARVLSQSARCILARVVEPQESTGAAIAERYGTNWTPELGELTDADAVVVAAPTELHYDLCLEILAADLPLLVEKPVTANIEHSEAVVAESDKRGVPLMCGLLERYNPAVLTALSVMDAPVHLVATRHSPYAPRIRTGVAWDLLVHDVDLAMRAYGYAEPIGILGSVGYFHPDSVVSAEDVAETMLTFPGGQLATVSASRISQRKVRSLVISEVDRLIEADLLRRDVTIYRHVALDTETPEGRGYRQQSILEIPELVAAREPLAAQLDRFLDILDGTVDADLERQQILPSHRVVASALNHVAS